jgi:protease I
MKKVLFIIAHTGYQPAEYGVPKQACLDAGFEVVTASDASGVATAKDNSTTEVDVVLSDVDAKEYDGIFMIGGSGALKHLDVQETNRIFNEAMLHNMPYGAICISPRILAKAHVLIDKKATGWNGDGELEQIFAQNNVQYIQKAVVVDENIITASGPEAAEEFGNAIVALLS